jgi:hypothetical protein
MNERLRSREEIAQLLDVPVKTLAAWAYKREGPPYFRVGKHAKYDVGEVREWLASRRVAR